MYEYVVLFKFQLQLISIAERCFFVYLAFCCFAVLCFFICFAFSRPRVSVQMPAVRLPVVGFPRLFLHPVPVIPPPLLRFRHVSELFLLFFSFSPGLLAVCFLVFQDNLVYFRLLSSIVLRKHGEGVGNEETRMGVGDDNGKWGKWGGCCCQAAMMSGCQSGPPFTCCRRCVCHSQLVASAVGALSNVSACRSRCRTGR